MDEREPSSGTLSELSLEREHQQVMTAIKFVASGGAVSVSLSGLRFAQQLLEGCSAEAASSGVLLEPRWWPEDAGCDLVVRRAEPSVPS